MAQFAQIKNTDKNIDNIFSINMTYDIIDEIEEKVQDVITNKRLDKIREPYACASLERTLQHSVNQEKFMHDRKRDETIDTLE